MRLPARTIHLPSRRIYRRVSPSRFQRANDSAGSGLGQSEVAFYLLDFAPNLLCAAVFVAVWPPVCFTTYVKSGDVELHSEIRTPNWNPTVPK